MRAKLKKRLPELFVLMVGLLVLLVLTSLPYKKTLPAFPLSKGTYWVYQGPTKWTPENSNTVIEKTLTWKMEVVDTIDLGQYFVAIVKGHPGDLAWYEDGKQRGDYLLIRKGASQYFLAFNKQRDAVLASAKTNPQNLDGLLNDDSTYIDFPLNPGKKWGNHGHGARTDNAYCWYVDSEKKISLAGISGLASSQTVTQYELRYYTNPDHEIIQFVEGVGITGFAYIHHGTVSETELHLIEFHAGGS